MKYVAILVGLFFLLSANTCSTNEDGHNSFTFKNNSKKSIYLQYNQFYPDTLFYCTIPNNGGGYDALYRPNANHDFGFNQPMTWEKEFNRLKKMGIDYLQLIVVDSVVYKTATCDSIREHNLILKRYQIDLATLEQNNWVITYP